MMLVSRNTFARCSQRILTVGLFLTFASASALADDRCGQLESLNRQYAGVSLSAYQQQVKRQMVAWYRQNCMSRRMQAKN